MQRNNFIIFSNLSFNLLTTNKKEIGAFLFFPLRYMHSSFVPPISHNNLKAANILLDEEFKPHVCDCGLSIVKPLSRNAVKLKAGIASSSS